METLPYVILAVGVSFLAIAAAIRFTLVHHEVRNKVAVLIILGSVIWLLMSALEVASDSLPTKLVFYKMQFVGVLIIPTTWLINTMQISGYERWIKRSTLAALSTVPVITLLLIFTNPHGLMWSNFTLNSVDPFLPLFESRGLGYWLLIVGYAYVALMFAVGIFVRRVLASRSLYRRQAVPLIFVSCVPWVFSVAWFLNPSLFMYIDPTALGLTVATSIVFWRLASLPGTDVIPVAHEMILDSMIEAVIILDSQTRIVELNPSAQQLVGHNLSDALGKPVESIWVDWAGVKNELDSGTERVREVSFGVGEEKKVYEMQASYLSGIMSERPNLLIVLRDTTERKQAEVALRESEARYRTLFDNANDALYLHDGEGRLLDVNNVACERIGYSREELLKMSLKDINSPEAAALIPQHMQEICERGQSVFESQEVRRDGSSFSVEVSVRPVSYKRESAMLGISRDITERKRMEKEVRQSEERYRLIAENITETIWLMDMNLKPTYISPSAVPLRGYTLEELYALPLDRQLTPDSLKLAWETFREALSEENLHSKDAPTSVTLELEFYRKDGSTFWNESTFTLISNSKGEPAGILGVGREITERKHMEESLRQYSEHLEELVAERTKELRKAERMATIGETAAMVGHDLRNPLQAMTSTLYLTNRLAESEKVEDRREAVELLHMLDEQVHYMDKIVSDLQDYARPVAIDPTETNLVDLIRETARNARLPENVDVSLGFRGDVSNMILDRTLFRRVLTNLVVNAVQAMPQGGKLTINASKEGESLTVTVQDTGVGIAQENLARIFNPFFTTKAKGQGLGLAVCRRLVEAQDGTITVTSELGKGSAFTFAIPTKLDR